MKHTYLPLYIALLGSLLFSACKKETPVFPGIQNREVNDRPYFFRAVIGGEAKEIRYDAKNEAMNFLFTDRTVFTPNGKCVGPGNIITGHGSDKNHPGTHFMYYCYNEAEVNGRDHFYQIFTPGKHPWYFKFKADSTLNQTEGGVVLNWTDKEGKKWSTQWGPQTLPYEISYSDPVAGPDGAIQVEVHARFSCVLYSEDGKVLKVENGEYFLPYEKLFQ